MSKIRTDLLGLVALTLLMKGYFDQALLNYPVFYLARHYPHFTANINHIAVPQLFLPLKDVNGVWATTGFILIYYLENWIGSVATYLLLNITTACVFYLVIRYLAESRVFALVASVAFITSTFNYHVYAISGSTNVYPFLIFGALALWAQVNFIRTTQPQKRYLFFSALVISVIAFALSYECWLDIIPWFLIVSPVIWLFLVRWYPRETRKRYSVSLSVWFIVMVIYLVIRTLPQYRQTFQAGTEADLVTSYWHNYGYAPIVDDVFSNIFISFYQAFSTLLPPGVGESLTLLSYNKREIAEFMLGYHAKFNDLVYPHYVYLWRYFAGAAFAFVIWASWKSAQTAIKQNDKAALVLFLGLCALLVGSPTHDLIKFRPYNAIPFLGYKSVFGAAGLFVSVGATVWMATLKVDTHRRRMLIVSSVCFYLLILGIVRPESLQKSADQTEMGRYPRPLHRLLVFWQKD